MCGIAGFVNLSGRLGAEELAALVRRMADSLAHRGPDDSGVWVDPSGRCAFSQRRLSIIDLSPAGHQPMLDEAGNALTFNGEIYNYRTLRQRMEQDGARFASASDTEVLLKGLATEGPDFVDRLDSMFAFGFYRAADGSLTLGRDIFGEKPLYYASTPDGFAFASELQALTLVPGFDPAIDRHRIATYLALQYLPAPLTIYTTASKLPPGHLLTLSREGEVWVRRYFRYQASPQQRSDRSLDDWADELEGILQDAVRTRLVTADVPVGAFLSGGVDSSTVVALAMKHAAQPIKTFSIGFNEGMDSEHREAEAIARHLGTEHHNEILPMEFFGERERIARVLDEPNGDSSCLPTWAVSRAARRQATVALSGDGGDELFGGYNRYLWTLGEEAARGSQADWDLGRTYYWHPMMIFVDSTLEKFIGPLPPETQALLESCRAPLRRGGKPSIQLMRESDIELYLPGDVLAKVDRMSMQHALEVRSPLLGREVAAFSMRLAAEDTCIVGSSKRVLKQVAQRYLPREWLDRPKKGFGIPADGAWGGLGLARDLQDLLTGPDCRLSGWVTPERLGRFVAYHLAKPGTHHMWPVYILEQWLRHHPARVV